MKKGLLHRLVGSAARAFGVSYGPADDFWYSTPGQTATFAGVPVTAETAMRTSAVYACVRVLAETIASLPLHVYERSDTGARQKRRATAHPLTPILHHRPNPNQTSFELREMLMGHCSLRGNAYTYIDIDRAGRIAALWPMHPAAVTPRYDANDQVVYDYRPLGKSMVTYQASRVMHWRGLSDDGLTGLGPLQLARDQISASRAADEYSGRFFANDGTPQGILRTDGKLGRTVEEYKKYRDAVKADWKESNTGKNRHTVPVLDQNLQWQSVGVDPESAQMLETRNFNVSDIARIFRVPPHKIGQLDKATFSNIEHQAIEFVMDTIRPWCVRLEQAMARALLTEDEQDRYFIEFNLEGLLRGDIKSRYEAYKIAWMLGWFNADEIRDLENANPMPGGLGQHYWAPVNQAPIQMILDGKIGASASPANDGSAGTPAGREAAIAAAIAGRWEFISKVYDSANGNKYAIERILSSLGADQNITEEKITEVLSRAIANGELGIADALKRGRRNSNGSGDHA